ncbi:MAG: DUF1761 domain-containing protein [Natronospirillum sp.]
MLTMLPQLNPFAVFAAFFLYCMLGALWFAVFFKKQYMEALGWGSDRELPQAPIFIVGPAICTLMVTVASAILLKALNVETFGELLEFTALVGFGYLVANTLNIAINPNMPRPIYYTIITGCYHLVGISIATTILYVMN